VLGREFWMPSSGRFARFFALAAVCVLFALAVTPRAALAQDCNTDLQRLSKARETQLAILNALAKAAKGKPIDAAAFCAKAGGFNATESALIAYMVKNQDWCSIPDDAINQLKANHAKSLAMSSKACSVAAQERKMQQQQAAGGQLGGPAPPALPSGPL